MTADSKKLQTMLSQKPGREFLFSVALSNHPGEARLIAAEPSELEHDARIAHKLMDPARKAPETPLENEQREVMRQLARALNSALLDYKPNTCESSLCEDCVREAVAALLCCEPFL